MSQTASGPSFLRDRRKHPRYEVHLRCWVTLSTNGGTFSGVTENVSREGALVILDQTPSAGIQAGPGHPAVLQLELPGSPSGPKRSLCCDATVVRISVPRLAFQVEHMEFQNLVPT